MRGFLALFFCLSTVFAGLRGNAEEFDSRFGVYMLGFKLGEFHLAGGENGSSYATDSNFKTTGIVAAVASVRFDFTANGHARRGGLAPSHYSENMHTGRERRVTNVTFPSPGILLDPATALFVGLRDRPLSEGCAQDFEVFDGRRTMRLAVRETARNGTEVICAGQLIRVSGYSDEEMAESSGFPIHVIFQAVGNLLQAQNLKAGSIHGNVTLKRLY